MATVELEFVQCPHSGCGGLWLPKERRAQLRENGESFYCPSGHSIYFAESENQKLRKQVKQLEVKLNDLNFCPLCYENYAGDRRGHLIDYHKAVRKPRVLRAA